MINPITIEEYFDRLWPICRSITGDGFRASMKILSEIVPWETSRFSSGTQVLDWKIPKEWNISDAYINDPNGKKRASFKENNLHVVGYSIPFKGTLDLSELTEYLHTLPNQPDAIPYLTSYYSPTWGFCLTKKEFDQLPEGKYEVVVDTTLEDGFLEYGEAVIVGDSEEEILFSSYLCHPSMANNELSGPLVLSFLYKLIASWPSHRYTYRFVLVPETIGSIAFLSVRGRHLKKKMAAGYQITCVGDGGQLTFKKSRKGNSLADKAGLGMMRELGVDNIISFSPAIGSDERQYCSPGFNLPVASLMRTMYTKYPEYHTSLDNKKIMSFDGMSEIVKIYEKIALNLENNFTYVNKNPCGEPQLSSRGLFRSLSSKFSTKEEVAIWWILNYSDGEHDLFDISQLSDLPFDIVSNVARSLEASDLLYRV